MTLDEAIVYAKEVAKEKYKEGFLCHANPDDEQLDQFVSCGREHEQLAQWLEELKEYKRLEEKLSIMFNGDCRLSDVVESLKRQISEPGKDHPVNARILTYEDAEKWNEYLKLEERGRLLKLPCKIDDTVWVVTSPINVFGFNDNVFGLNHRDEDAEYEVYESFISSVSYYAQGEQFRIYAKVTNNFIAAYFRECDFGKTVFLTREEAKAKLKEIHERKIKNE